MNTTKRIALFISPHLDDVVFSCGGTLAKMSNDGWHTILCTVFTKSVVKPTGFALACQLDKNLAPEVDYMKLRRAEDCRAARVLGVSEVLHLNFSEAPHRGYDSAPELFAGVKSGDEIWKSVSEHLALLKNIHQPEIIFAPQGLGNHCDHLQTIDSVLETFSVSQINWYYDTPYIIRQPYTLKYQHLPAQLISRSTDISAYIDSKIAASVEYESQIVFQFGGRKQLEQSLLKFHNTSENNYVELFLGSK